MPDPKETLHRYLKSAREAVLWKLEGVGEYDARRPLTPTGTNLLGLVKHLAYIEHDYFGACLGRPSGEGLTWSEEDPHSDLIATAEESREDILALHARVTAFADARIEELPLDAPGEVPWWPEERKHVTLHLLLVHVIAETNRHAGHMDILRETVDGAAGLRPGGSNLPDGQDWEAHVARVEQTAREAVKRRAPQA